MGETKVKVKNIKRSVSILLATVMLIGSCLTVFANLGFLTSGKQTYTNAAQLATFTFKGYNNGTTASPTTTLGLLQYTLDTFNMGNDYNGPIGIVKASLNRNGIATPVYIVALSGTELILSQYSGLQSTGALTDLLCGFNLTNSYVTAVERAIQNNVPRGANILFYGHSLGGMIAQEATSRVALRNNYNIVNTVTYGSPLIRLLWIREGSLKRLCDKSDIVPILSVYTLTPLAFFQFWGQERMVENGGYNGDWLAAHNESYLREDVWGGYDVLGVKGGNATLTFNMDDANYYEAPAISWLTF